MPGKVLVCELCRTAGKVDFKAPYDSVGTALMEAHLRDVHKFDDQERRLRWTMS